MCFLLLLVTLVIKLVHSDLMREYVLVEDFSTTLSSELAGLTSEAVTDAFVSRLHAIQDSSSTRQDKNSYIHGVASNSKLDWEMVERGSGFEILVRVLRGIVSGQRTTIKGAVNSQGDSLFIACRMRIGDHRPSDYLLSGSMETVDSMLNHISEIALRDLEPYTLASYLYNLDKDSSLAVVQHCLTHKPTDDDYLAYYLWGIILHDKGKKDEAVEKYEKSIERHPEFSWSYTNKGVVLMEQKRYDSALSTFQIANELDADDPINLINLGRALNSLGQYSDGRRVLKRSIEIDPYYPAAYVNLGVGFDELGDSAQAVRMYHAAIELDSTFAIAYFNIGTLYHDNGELFEAIEYYLRSIELDSTYSPAYSDCGVALADRGLVDSALAMYNKAIMLDSTDPKPVHNRGNILYKRGEFSQAIGVYEVAIKLCPTCSTAVSARQWIDSAKARLQ